MTEKNMTEENITEKNITEKNITEKINNITLNFEEITDLTIPQLLEDNDIMLKMEEGTGSTSTTKVSDTVKPIEQLENYINLKADNNFDYDSEDENLLHLMDNMRIKNMPPFKKLEFKDVEYKIDQSYSDINHKYSSALDILASYLKGHKIIWKLNFIVKLI